MGASDCFMNDDSATASFVGLGDTSVMLWQPGSLALYADEFAEEFIELWGNEPTVDDAQQLATEYSAADTHAMERIIRQNARVWFIYTNSTCWEMYAKKRRLLDETRAHLSEKPWVKIYKSDADRRASAFSAAGLSKVWVAMNGG
jgi:hypothetical protein